MKPTQQILQEILEEVRPLIGQGKVANYIPALAKVPASKFGIAVFTNQGEVVKAGDADEAFSIQSISKALSLTLAMCLYKPEEIWARVGKEPSGQALTLLFSLKWSRAFLAIRLSMPEPLLLRICLIVACRLLASVYWSLFASCLVILISVTTRLWPLQR